jgi:hypothetical protein
MTSPPVTRELWDEVVDIVAVGTKPRTIRVLCNLYDRYNLRYSEDKGQVISFLDDWARKDDPSGVDRIDIDDQLTILRRLTTHVAPFLFPLTAMEHSLRVQEPF